MHRYLLLLPCFFIVADLHAQQDLYATDTLQEIRITFPTSNWDYMMDTAKAGSDGYVLATQVLVNGVLYDSIGVRFKGNSSYDTAQAKNPLHIKLDYIHNTSDYQGYTDIKLSNCYSDPTWIREVLGYEILRNYMAAPRCNFARVFINNVYYGVYTSSESIDKDFLSNHFYSSDNSFFKCNPVSTVNGQYPNLSYLGTDSANYYNRYEIKSGYTWKDLTSLCDTLNNFSASLDSILDIDRALWMLAYNDVTVNLDSYTGAFSQNYYLYRDDNRRFAPVIWDLNMCFGGFRNTGTGNLTIPQMVQMSPILHSTNTSRPLIVKLLGDPRYGKMYIAHMRTIDAEFFANGNYLTRAQQMQALIDTSVQSETFGFYPYATFQSSLTTDNGNIPGLGNLMGPRSTYLNTTAQFQQVPPVITNVSTVPAVPNIYDTVHVACKVSNNTSVWLGWRSATPYRFRRIQMYDDGLHNDGLANDSVFGADVYANTAITEYYIYAENANAGVFSPARAEYEFYSIIANVNSPMPGDLVINEFCADNQNSAAIDEQGKHEDWIEIYNLSPNPIGLLGTYLTDDYTVPHKWAFPDVVLPVNGYAIIWADEDPGTITNMHCNFRLSAFGEQLMLTAIDSTVIDSVTYPVQTTDVSWGRCPNGTGSFGTQPNMTMLFMNCGMSVPETDADHSFSVFPNPAKDAVNFYTNDTQVNLCRICSVNGEMLSSAKVSNGRAVIDLGEFAAGIYFYQALDANGAVLHSGRIILAR